MTDLRINTQEQFEHWLSANSYFVDARVLSLLPYPKCGSSELPPVVTIDLAYQIEGNYKAHSTRVSRVFRLPASGIVEYCLGSDGIVSPEHWSEGIETLGSDCPIAFEIDVPALLTLLCSEISVEELPILTETVTPWLSDREVFAKVLSVSMPTPAQWQRRFNELDQDVVWHVYGDAPKKTEEVPPSNYEGWFLQTQKDLDETHDGILFLSCKPEENGFWIQIQNHGASGRLWQAAMTTLVAFEKVEIHCGNCEFSGAEFLLEWRKWISAQGRK